MSEAGEDKAQAEHVAAVVAAMVNLGKELIESDRQAQEAALAQAEQDRVEAKAAAWAPVMGFLCGALPAWTAPYLEAGEVDSPWDGGAAWIYPAILRLPGLGDIAVAPTPPHLGGVKEPISFAALEGRAGLGDDGVPWMGYKYPGAFRPGYHNTLYVEKLEVAMAWAKERFDWLEETIKAEQARWDAHNETPEKVAPSPPPPPPPPPSGKDVDFLGAPEDDLARAILRLVNSRLSE